MLCGGGGEGARAASRIWRMGGGVNALEGGGGVNKVKTVTFEKGGEDDPATPAPIYMVAQPLVDRGWWKGEQGK